MNLMNSKFKNVKHITALICLAVSLQNNIAYSAESICGDDTEVRNLFNADADNKYIPNGKMNFHTIGESAYSTGDLDQRVNVRENTPLIVSCKPLNSPVKYTKLGNYFDSKKALDFRIVEDVKNQGKVTEAINGAKLEMNLDLSTNQTVTINYDLLIADHRANSNDFLIVKVLKDSKPYSFEQVLFQSASTRNWTSGLQSFQWTADEEGAYTIELTVVNGYRVNPDVELTKFSIKDGSMFSPGLIIRDVTVSDN